MLACKNARAFDRATDMRKKAPRIQRMSGAFFEYRLAARERGGGPAKRCVELIRYSWEKALKPQNLVNA